MGLDQFAYTKREDEADNFAEWRKHPNLEGWMRQLWESQGNSGEFNIEEVELTLEDIEHLQKDILNKNLPTTGGFFFGSNSDEYYFEYDLEFCAKAKECLSNQQRVYYSSWW